MKNIKVYFFNDSKARLYFISQKRWAPSSDKAFTKSSSALIGMLLIS